MLLMEHTGHLEEMSLGSLFAESLEKEASMMPPEQRLEAHSLRRQAEPLSVVIFDDYSRMAGNL
jgi:hypothetical protein